MVMNESISQVYIKWRKDIDNAIFGEIKTKAIEHGIETEYALNEKAIISALEKQIPRKPNIHGFREGREVNTISFTCPVCNKHISRENFCKNCGQAILWESDI